MCVATVLTSLRKFVFRAIRLTSCRTSVGQVRVGVCGGCTGLGWVGKACMHWCRGAGGGGMHLVAHFEFHAPVKYARTVAHDIDWEVLGKVIFWPPKTTREGGGGRSGDEGCIRLHTHFPCTRRADISYDRMDSTCLQHKHDTRLWCGVLGSKNADGLGLCCLLTR